MNDQAVSVLDALCEKFGFAIDWTQQNVVPYLETLMKRLISYELATSFFWIVFWGAITIISFLITKKFYGASSELDHDPDEPPFALMAAGIILTATLVIVFVPVFLSQAIDIITCYTFPEKIIINQLSSLVK